MTNTIDYYSVPVYFEESPPVAYSKPVFRPMIRELLDIAHQSVFKAQESIVQTTSLMFGNGSQVFLSLRNDPWRTLSGSNHLYLYPFSVG
jgi:hypothetical protein